MPILEKQGVHPTQGGDFPIAGGDEEFLEETNIGTAFDGLFDTQRFGQGQPKHREAVGHADTQMNGQSRRGYQPAVKALSCNDAFFGQKTWRVVYCCHVVSVLGISFGLTLGLYPNICF